MLRSSEVLPEVAVRCYKTSFWKEWPFWKQLHVQPKILSEKERLITVENAVVYSVCYVGKEYHKGQAQAMNTAWAEKAALR